MVGAFESCSPADDKVNSKEPERKLSHKLKRVPHKLSFIHLNIRSLKNRNHILQLREFVRVTNYHIIILSETWLNKSVKNAEVKIEGYKIFRLDQKDKRGGGVCAYIRSPLKAQILKDLSGTSTTWFQQLWLQVQYKKNYIIRNLCCL